MLDYGSNPPIDLMQKIRSCFGVVVFGPPQLRVVEMVSGSDREGVTAGEMSTPWNQLEAGIALGMEKPILVLRQGAHGGVFDVPESPSLVTVLDIGV